MAANIMYMYYISYACVFFIQTPIVGVATDGVKLVKLVVIH